MVTPWYAAEKLTLSDRPDAHKFPWRRHFSSDSDYLFTGRRARDGRAATTVCASAHLSCPGSPLSPWLIIMQAWRQRARWYYWNIIYEAEIKFNVPCVRMRARVCVCVWGSPKNGRASVSWELDIFFFPFPLVESRKRHHGSSFNSSLSEEEKLFLFD